MLVNYNANEIIAGSVSSSKEMFASLEPILTIVLGLFFAFWMVFALLLVLDMLGINIDKVHNFLRGKSFKEF